MFKTILVGVDGSEPALRAAHLAGELARASGADVWVVTCYDPLPTYLGEPFLDAAIAARITAAEGILTPALQEIGAIEGQLQSEILEGPPAEAILAVSETRGVDLIVMGTRGQGRLSGLLVGSQSQKVLANARCPVLITH